MSDDREQARSITKYAELMDAESARTRRFCANQPHQQEVHTALLRAEKAIHQGGWDSPPRIIVLQRNSQTHRVRHTELEKFSRMLAQLPGRTADALEQLAYACEWIRRPTSKSGQFPRRLPPVLLDMMSRVHAAPDSDLLGLTEGTWRFHGVGMVYEGWMVFNVDTAAEELAGRHELYTHRERVEVRQAFYVARDGWTWELTRVRRTPVIALPRHCIVLHQDNDAHSVGVIPHALSRMCNAIASNPVPIVPATHVSDE